MNARDMELLANECVALTLTARDGLPKAANGRPLAPSFPAAVSIRKEMSSGASREWFRVATVLHTDLLDGVDYERVRLPLLKIDASLALAAGLGAEQSLNTLSVAEQRIDGVLDIDQIRLAENKDDPAFLDRFIERCARQIAATKAMKRAAELQRARLRGSAIRVFGPSQPRLARLAEVGS